MVGLLALFAGWVYRDVPSQRLTRLDDSIFIEENYSFNRDKSAYSKALTRGVFREKGDSYYRPLLLWSFVADARMHQLKLEGYLQTNVRLHLFFLCFAFCSFMLPWAYAFERLGSWVAFCGSSCLEPGCGVDSRKERFFVGSSDLHWNSCFGSVLDKSK